MKKLFIIITLVLLVTGTAIATERPSDADLMAFKVYHHMVYTIPNRM